MVISPVDSVPADIDDLLIPSLAEGYHLVERFVTCWADGSNRFDGEGEVFLEVRRDDRLVAVGGLNRDPYLEDWVVGRIRHVYVHPDARRAGIGRALVTALIERARGHFHRIRVRAGPPAAGDFYLGLGFERTPDADQSTHELLF